MFPISTLLLPQLSALQAIGFDYKIETGINTKETILKLKMFEQGRS